MSNLQAFFQQNVPTEMEEDFVVSKRFTDKDGNPIPWKLKTISEEQNKEIRKSVTKRTKVRGQGYVAETDHEAYVSRLIAASVVFPNLKDSELQKSYGVIGEEDLLQKMLISGEYGRLAQKVQQLNGFDEDLSELVETVKN